MPTVDKDTCWLDGHHFNLTFNIDAKGTYYCNLPEPLAKSLKFKKVTAITLGLVKSEVRAHIQAYQAAQPDEFCPDRRHRR